jgi:leader peptidase (prepilin peptidase)/N-methyltransferase
MEIYFAVLSGIVGLVIGSFLNVCIYRIPLGRSIAYPPSACAACGHKLNPLDLFPVFSYLFLKGKCRYCGNKISFIYPAVELLTAALFVLLYFKFSLSIALLFYMITACLLIIASFVDIAHQEIPNGIVIALLITGIAYTLLDLPLWTDHVIGLFAGGLPLLIVAAIAQYGFKKEAMGGGDIKLMAALGLICGWKLILLALFLGIIAGAVYAIVLLFTKKAKRSSALAFGPFLSAGFMFSIFFGEGILFWYLSLLW